MQLPDAIVDSHHHLWDLSRPGYGWLQDAYDPSSFLLGEYRPICRDFLPQDFRQRWQGLPVVGSVHVEAECDRSLALAETAWLHEIHAAHGLPHAVVAWVDLLAPDAPERLAEQARFPLVRSIRFKPVTARQAGTSVAGQPGALDDPLWPSALQHLLRHGLAWDLRVPFWHLEEAARVVAQCPELPVVLEHTGLPWDRSAAGLAQWRRGLQALAACPRVELRLSEFGLRGAPWDAAGNIAVVREALAIFGWQRCMFGSNFPVASLRVDYRSLVGMMATALQDLPAHAQRAVWHDNACRFYRLRPAAKNAADPS